METFSLSLVLAIALSPLPFCPLLVHYLNSRMSCRSILALSLSLVPPISLSLSPSFFLFLSLPFALSVFRVILVSLPLSLFLLDVTCAANPEGNGVDRVVALKLPER